MFSNGICYKILLELAAINSTCYKQDYNKK